MDHMEMLTNILLLENLAQQSYDVSCGVFKPCTLNITRKLILYSNHKVYITEMRRKCPPMYCLNFSLVRLKSPQPT